MPLIALDAAGNGFRKTGIELHRRQYQGRIQWHEEHSGRRRRDRAVGSIENAVTKDAVAVQIVGDGEIKRLIEIAQPLLRLQQNGGRQHGERHDCEDDFVADCDNHEA